MKPTKTNYKPFDLEAAKAGEPVCTRDGRAVRILCFDREYVLDDDAGNNTYFNIVALVTSSESEHECIDEYTLKGEYVEDRESDSDLVMSPKVREYWTNVYSHYSNIVTGGIFSSKEIAVKSITPDDTYVLLNTVLLYTEEV